MSVENVFSNHYREAREKFLTAAARAGAEVTSYRHPLQGPRGESLAMDVARLGSPACRRLLVTTSATHGVEGYCGSAVQVGLFETPVVRPLPSDTALLQVHAHNPHGFAHDRRVTEGNVDLNRNFVDFSRPRPENAAYAEVHRLIMPTRWSGPARVAADLKIAAYVATRGQAELQRALTSGQYNHADGLFYGGREPTWSHRTVRELAATWVAGHEHVAVLDFHTGLGPRGFGELIVDGGTDDAGYRRARDWLGHDVKSPATGDSVSTVVVGTVDTPYRDAVGADNCTFVTVEFGTLPPLDVLQALRADNWLYLHGDASSNQGRQIKRDIRAAFYGEDLAWKEQVWARSREVVEKTMSGLAAL